MERNKPTLRDALDRLPQHLPPPATWDDIADALPPPLAGKLPVYAPNATVWNAISRRMEAEDEAAGRHRAARLRRLPLRRLLGAAAAAVAVLLVAVFALRSPDHRQQVTVAYHQEATPAPFVDDSGLDDGSFDRAIAAVEARNEPGLNSLRHELDELTAARQEVKAMLASYGDDPAVIRQLAEIERDRSDIYRRIIVAL